jgi:hypothetical protein
MRVDGSGVHLGSQPLPLHMFHDGTHVADPDHAVVPYQDYVGELTEWVVSHNSQWIIRLCEFGPFRPETCSGDGRTRKQRVAAPATNT